MRVDIGLSPSPNATQRRLLLFDYKSTESGQRVVPGSIEMLDSGRAIKVVVQLGQMPRYHEQVIGDALGQEAARGIRRTRPASGQRDTPDARRRSGEHLALRVALPGESRSAS